MVMSQMGDAMCNLIDRCFGDASAHLIGPDCGAIMRSRLLEASLPILQGSIDSGAIQFDAAKAAACVAQIGSTPCSGLLSMGDMNPVADCEGAFVGTIAEGSACGTSDECAGEAVCVTEEACPGTCVAQVDEGGECNGNDEICKSPTSCVAGICTAPLADGAACEEGNGAECDDGLECTMGTCQAAMEGTFDGRNGAMCDVSAGTLCAAGHYCAITPTGQTCKTIASAGQACSFGLLTACEAGTYCQGIDFEAMAFEGTCVALPGDGEACLEDGFPCTPGLVCDTSGATATCTALKHIGEACGGSDVCFSSRCADGACAPGVACDDDSVVEAQPIEQPSDLPMD
jgi:hypothetical protein